jgi:methionyl aminopeptidase
VKQPAATTSADEQAAYEAAQKVVETHYRLSDFLARGQTLAEIDGFVARTLDDLDCRSCFLGYKVPRLPPFPSHACLSINECVVHGTSFYNQDELKPGDLLKIDIGVWHNGWIGDAAWTYVFGEPTAEVAKLMEAGKTCIKRGVDALGPGKPYSDWAQAVQDCVEAEYGLHLVRGLGGHGYGRKLHAPPFISNVMPRFRGEWSDADRRAVPGTLLAVEPMLAIGTGDIHQPPREWPIYSADGSLTAHYEHDVLITESGVRVLTEGLDEVPDVITR